MLPTSLPTAPTSVEVLALLTRVRSVKIATGQLDESRLYDLRAFKSCWAELAYLHRLAAGGRYGGTVVTSMRQLVAGIAALHPTWKMTDDPWADRDRHHRAVRRRLSALAGAGLLDWRIGLDENLEERRTELQLLPVPEVLPGELSAAADRLALWSARYNAELNTGSPIELANIYRAAGPLSASERQRRGCIRARQAAQARRLAEQSQTNSAPPFGAPSEKNLLPPNRANQIEDWKACGSRTRVTRASLAATANAISAVNPTKTAAGQEHGPSTGRVFPAWDDAPLMERISARKAARRPVEEFIARQATQRAAEVASWPAKRIVPSGRLREAWVVWRQGAPSAADGGSAGAGPLDARDLERLGRAARRYERSVKSRPEGWPDCALGALQQIAEIAAERGARPLTLHYGIRVLDQLSRRMRANATARNPAHLKTKAARASARHQPAPPVGYAFRRGSRNGAWPAWVSLDDQGQPVLMGGKLEIVDGHVPWSIPAPNDPRYLETLRDAHLLAGLWPSLESDGRFAMARRNHRGVELPAHASAGPYTPPPDRPTPHATGSKMEPRRPRR